MCGCVAAGPSGENAGRCTAAVETTTGGSRRERIVFRPWRKNTGLRRMAGRMYEVVMAGCIVTVGLVNPIDFGPLAGQKGLQVRSLIYGRPDPPRARSLFQLYELKL